MDTGTGTSTASTPIEKPLAPAAAPASTWLDPDEEAELRGLPVDRLVHAWEAQLTGGISPAALMGAFSDWWIHLLNAPGKRADLIRKAFRKGVRFTDFLVHAPFDRATPPAIEPLPDDRRFDGAEWRLLPFAAMWQGFLFTQQWWHNATTGVRGVDPKHAEIVRFTMRQILDALSPANFIPTNPEVLRATAENGGRNLWTGWLNFVEDAERSLLGKPPVGAEAFAPGRDVAITPGKVIFRNRLMELIQYSPATATVRAEPVLIVPAWIMKYYILDLSPANSLVRFLVERGHTVFMISWKNPGAEDRDVGMADYLERGALEAIRVVRRVAPEAPIHAVGYCLGGTLLAIAAARLARLRDDSLGTVTLFAAQTDFAESGELSLFINDSQVAWLEDMMWDQGYLDTRQMAGAFQLVRSTDLIWSAMVRQYLLGERAPMTDLMAWNADATRLPYRMHSDHLRNLFLDNALARGHYLVGEEPVSLRDVKLPVFAVSAMRDHIAPWRSVFKVTWLTGSDVTFVLASGGHNVGIISEPGPDGPLRAGRGFRIGTIAHGDNRLDPDAWLRGAAPHQGSWWPSWAEWLESRSSGTRPARIPGEPAGEHAALEDAPGRYVLMR